MREIREKISELTNTYGEQLGLYQQIRDVGSQEQELISRGYLERLLEALKKKEDLLRCAGELETTIKLIQVQLGTHFGLSDFSVPRLKQQAPAYYQDDIQALEAAVTKLVPILEVLEEQERRNEASLSQYLENSQGPKTNTVQFKRAGRAYGKK